MSDLKETMTVSDVMKALGISRMTVHRRIKEGKLRPINSSPALYRQHKLYFHRSNVEELLQDIQDTAQEADFRRRIAC